MVEQIKSRNRSGQTPTQNLQIAVSDVCECNHHHDVYVVEINRICGDFKNRIDPKNLVSCLGLKSIANVIFYDNKHDIILT